MAKIVLVGSPNVGKSVIFNCLTGTYTTVSNYPGTTVDVFRGHCSIGGREYEIIDTPGIYSLIPTTDDERVTRELLSQEKPDIVIHVADAKNISRMLNLTLDLINAGLPVILNLNIIDEAYSTGMIINLQCMAEKLGVPVVATSAVKKLGMEDLRRAIFGYKYQPGSKTRFSPAIEQTADGLAALLTSEYNMTKRMAALLLMQGDETLGKLIKKEPLYREIVKQITKVAKTAGFDAEQLITMERQATVNDIISWCVTVNSRLKAKGNWSELLGRVTREPITGIPILILVLYFGIYQFVGRFGAGFLVDYIDNSLFAQYITPFVENMIHNNIEVEWLQSIIISEYGIFTLGFRYAVVIILPIVGTFFLMLAILEDCGYLPRLAMLLDGLFKKFGLNGRSVIPLTLGLGCGTMAVMATRTLETRRERLLATFLLALAVPCSAQLGVVLALLSHNGRAVLLWAAYVLAVLVGTGWLAAKIIRGPKSLFYIELPPLRMPVLANVLTKAYNRMVWYFNEVLPVFILTSIVMWLADRTEVLSQLIRASEPVIRQIGLPAATAQAFLLGFFRRDYGAAGLYDLFARGSLSDSQLLIAAVTLTLFLPCIAQLTIMIKERGLISSSLIVMVIMGVSWLAAYGLYFLLTRVPLL